MKFPVRILMMIVACLVIACEEEIPWEVSNMPEMLVVEGTFTNQYDNHQVKLTRSVTYFYNQPAPTVSGATVTISDGTVTYPLVENPVGSGIYETDDSVAGRAGKTYTLDIYLAEAINNETHYYSSGTMVPGINIENTIAYIYENPMYGIVEESDSLMIIMIALGLDPEDINNYYQLDLYKNGVLLNDTIDERAVMNDTEGLNGEYVSSFYFFYEFEPNDRVEFEIQSVERNYYEFVINTQNLAGQSFDPFNMSGPPANATTNIEGGEAIGFFKVAYVSRGFTYAEIYNEEE